jgi:hypothetical protein
MSSGVPHEAASRTAFVWLVRSVSRVNARRCASVPLNASVYECGA